MIYTSIDKRYPYMAMLCELIDKYFVETLLCSGGGKMSIEDIHREDGVYDKAKCCNYSAFTGIK